MYRRLRSACIRSEYRGPGDERKRLDAEHVGARRTLPLVPSEVLECATLLAGCTNMAAARRDLNLRDVLANAHSNLQRATLTERP